MTSPKKGDAREYSNEPDARDYAVALSRQYNNCKIVVDKEGN